MVTIFSRVREKLIASGSVTKYLLYATGEVLLVVIGILLALQVNNWNEQRKDAMRSKLTEDGGPGTGEISPLQPADSGGAARSLGVSAVEDYHPKLMVKTQKTGNTVTIEIEDNGPGIPDEIKDKILQPFFTTKKGTQGTGLGLSITNDVIKAHGGSLEIYSEPGQTQFRIILNA